MTLEQEIQNSLPIPPRARAALNILFTASWLDTQMNRTMRDYGLTHPQYNILRILKGTPDGLSVLDIKGRMIDRSSNVSRLVEKLREQGYAQRVASDEDRRMVIVSITPEGLELVAKIGDGLVDGSNPNTPGKNMTEDELMTLSVLIDKFREVE
jgi:DNA-binding MarR family transcriptional regulator